MSSNKYKHTEEDDFLVEDVISFINAERFKEVCGLGKEFFYSDEPGEILVLKVYVNSHIAKHGRDGDWRVMERTVYTLEDGELRAENVAENREYYFSNMKDGVCGLILHPKAQPRHDLLIRLFEAMNAKHQENRKRRRA